MEKLLAVTDIFALGRGLLLGAEFYGEAESNTDFEHVFEPKVTAWFPYLPHYLGSSGHSSSACFIASLIIS